MKNQKTITVRGKVYSGRQIAKMMSDSQMTTGGDYIISLNGRRYFANYRQEQDQFFAPVCGAECATAISLMPDDGMFLWSIWLTL